MRCIMVLANRLSKERPV